MGEAQRREREREREMQKENCFYVKESQKCKKKRKSKSKQISLTDLTMNVLGVTKPLTKKMFVSVHMVRRAHVHVPETRLTLWASKLLWFYLGAHKLCI